MRRVSFHTLGCKVNQYETEAMRLLMREAGWETAEEGDVDAVVINSCTVTAESDRKLRQLLRRLRRENPSAVIAVAGCMPQAFPEAAAALTEADIVVGNAARRDLPRLIEKFLADGERIVDVAPHSRAYESLAIDGFEGHTRAFVKIEDGCDRFCTYCIIPYARGRVRSRSLADLRAELVCLATRGFVEAVLVGINLTAYGKDCGLNIADAVEAAASVEGIRRVRLGSIEPDFLTPDILKRLAAVKEFCPQFHLALQSGCDATLKRMNRHYTTAEYAALVDDIRAAFPDAAITTDVMVGFPGETEEEFAASLAFVERIGFARSHIFAYSRRPGTPAAKAAGQLTAAVKAERSRRLQAVSDRDAAAFAARFVGREVSVLLETRRADGYTEGYTPAYLPVCVATDRPAGDIVTVRVERAEGPVCYGREVPDGE